MEMSGGSDQWEGGGNGVRCTGVAVEGEPRFRGEAAENERDMPA